MKKTLSIFILMFLLFLTACEPGSMIRDVYEYDLTEENVIDYIEITIQDIEVEFDNHLFFTVKLDFNMDDDEGEPSDLLVILFEIHMKIVLSYEKDDKTVYIEESIKLGSGFQNKDGFITLKRQIMFNDYSLEDYEIIFDHIIWVKVTGNIILSNPIE